MASPSRPLPANLVWAGPAAAIVLMALAGQLFGVLGALIAAGAACSILVFGVADASAAFSRRRAFVIVVVTLFLVMVVFAWQGALWWWKGSAPVRDPMDHRGAHVAPGDVGSLRGALLAGADLRGLDLRNRSFAGVSAPGAVFAEADLTDASLRGADLRGADLRGACLVRTDLAGTDLSGAQVDRAQLTVPGGAVVVGAPLPPGQRAPGCR